MWRGAQQQRDRYKGIQSDTDRGKRGLERGMEEFKKGADHIDGSRGVQTGWV